MAAKPDAIIKRLRPLKEEQREHIMGDARDTSPREELSDFSQFKKGMEGELLLLEKIVLAAAVLVATAFVGFSRLLGHSPQEAVIEWWVAATVALGFIYFLFRRVHHIARVFLSILSATLDLYQNAGTEERYHSVVRSLASSFGGELALYVKDVSTHTFKLKGCFYRRKGASFPNEVPAVPNEMELPSAVGGYIIPCRRPGDEVTGFFWACPGGAGGLGTLPRTCLEIVGYLVAVQQGEESVRRQLLLMGTTDHLTQVSNRYKFWEVMNSEVERARRYKYALSLILIDVDELKVVNDRYGHLVGDNLLAHIATLIRSIVRGSDTVARIGGDEFAIVLPYAGHQEAQEVARRLMTHLKEQSLPISDGEPVPVTVSYGIATLLDSDDSAHDIFRRTDQALYEDKNRPQGRSLRGSRYAT